MTAFLLDVCRGVLDFVRVPTELRDDTVVPDESVTVTVVVVAYARSRGPLRMSLGAGRE